MNSSIRPANMRVTHGLQGTRCLSLSVASVLAVEGTLCDPWNVRESGGGMDAPEDLPVGSVKAFFKDNGYGDHTIAFGFCQRTVNRETGRPT